MDFRYTTEHDAFRASLSGFLLTAPLRWTRGARSGRARQAALARLCKELELPGLHVPREYGGAGGTLVDTAIAFCELGRALSPVPLAATTFAIEAVLCAGDEEQRPGCSRACSAENRSERSRLPRPTTPIHPRRRCGRTGTAATPCSPARALPCLHGHVADLFVVPAVADGVITLHVVAADAPGVTVVALPSFDITRPVARLRLAQAPCRAARRRTADQIGRVLDVARVLLAAEMLGGAEACLAMAVEYARTRRQFDRPIGSFQAVKHACAEMMIEIDATRAAVMYAAMSAASGDELRIAGPLAKAQAADTYAQCAGSAIQVHGGIAFTWEHDLHLYFRRAKTTQALFGGSTHHRRLLAERAGL